MENRDCTESDPHHSPWICHICDTKSTSESVACSVCYRVTCHLHLTHVTELNRESGLYELNPICLDCAAERMLD
jgi:hypothetical protein